MLGIFGEFEAPGLLTRFRAQGFRVLGFRVFGFRVLGFRV